MLRATATGGGVTPPSALIGCGALSVRKRGAGGAACRHAHETASDRVMQKVRLSPCVQRGIPYNMDGTAVPYRYWPPVTKEEFQTGCVMTETQNNTAPVKALLFGLDLGRVRWKKHGRAYCTGRSCRHGGRTRWY